MMGHPLNCQRKLHQRNLISYFHTKTEIGSRLESGLFYLGHILNDKIIKVKFFFQYFEILRFYPRFYKSSQVDPILSHISYRLRPFIPGEHIPFEEYCPLGCDIV
jgi:hypothetical protein